MMTIRTSTMAAAMLIGLGTAAWAGEMRIVAQLPDQPEGIAVSAAGDLYATTHAGQQVFRIHDDGTYDLVATVPSEAERGQGEALGIEFDGDGNLIVAYTQHSEFNQLFDPRNSACADTRVTRSGVYRVNVETGAVEAIATRGDGHPFCYPDDVDVDSAGNIYLTDLTYAGIWKIAPDGTVALWSADPLLNSSDPALPLGVNVLVLDHAEKNIFAATTTIGGRIVRIPINEDGTAGEAVAHSLGHTYFDGIEIDADGYIYAAESGVNQIIAVSPEAGWLGLTPRLVIGKGEPLQGPTSLVLRDGVLYTANLAFGLPAEAKNRAIVAISGFGKP